MNLKLSLVIISLFASIIVFMPFSTVSTDDDYKHGKWHNSISNDDDDDDYHHNRKREHKRDDHHGNYSKRAKKNTVYQETCGECHFAYDPEFMPSASWTRLMENLKDHFGESIDLDDNSIKTITDYLNTNSADNSRTKRGAKVIRSLTNKIPERITEIPYLLHEHHEIPPDVFERESIGSFANCGACHTTAIEGIYDDDNVKIPR